MTGADLTFALAAIGWSQRELARWVGVPESRVRRWARGTIPVPEVVAEWLQLAAEWHVANPPPRVD
jgi:ribosome-binding protein aMBF1 (putative translation factor)